MYLKWSKEMAHQEMIAAIVYQLTRNLTPEQIKEGGFDAYFTDHTTGVYPQSAAGVPFTAAYLQSKGDPITDLFEDLAAEGALCSAQHLKAPNDRDLNHTRANRTRSNQDPLNRSGCHLCCHTRQCLGCNMCDRFFLLGWYLA